MSLELGVALHPVVVAPLSARRTRVSEDCRPVKNTNAQKQSRTRKDGGPEVPPVADAPPIADALPVADAPPVPDPETPRPGTRTRRTRRR
jgi:hypothetical protein